MQVIYEDNHVIIVSKRAGEIVQGDKTGDRTLMDDVKQYIKAKYQKPGEAFLGLVHRLDRPVSGVVVFARTSKALTRLNEMFRTHAVQKTYRAITLLPSNPKGAAMTGHDDKKAQQATIGKKELLTHWIVRNERLNKSFAHNHEVPGSKKAELEYSIVAHGDRYDLVEVDLHTGRHHQIRCQLSAIGRTIKGDLKYGAPRSNPDGSICLHAYRVRFEHPVSHQTIDVTAPPPPSFGIFER